MTSLEHGPLAGFRVLEMGSTVAGPFCGRLLADFGAEVIKVENPEGDPVRSMGSRAQGKSLYAASIFRNKLLVSINLRTLEGQSLIKRMMPQCDVLVENFRPGTMEKWGLGYSQLSDINPRLVMVRISGYGQSGPHSQRPGYGITAEAFSGLRHITGDPDRPPARVAVSLTDYITGLYGAFGALMALLARERTGRGQCIDAALYECAFSFMEPHIPAFEKLGVVAMRSGSRLPGNAPNNLYATGDGQFIHITAGNDGVFRRLAQVMRRPELLENSQFRTATARAEHTEDLDDIISGWVCQHDIEELDRELNAADIPASRIYTIADIFRDPHYQARQMLEKVPDDDLESVTLAAVVPKLSETPGRIQHSGRRIGQDTLRVIAELVGLTEIEILRLAEQKVVCLGPTGGS